MIDTHTHLFSAEFDADREEALQRAIAAGVEEFYLPNIDADTVDAMLVLAKAHPRHCYPMLGLHPTSVGADYRVQLDRLEARLEEYAWAAIGEIGTDLHWSDEFWEQQRDAFRVQCGWAVARDLPVAVHCRNSIDETLELIEPFAAQGLRGVLHCFTGSVEQALRAAELGLYFGIGGVLTYKNNGELPEVVRRVPRARLVLETDSPYLAPVPKRGRRNESAYLPYVLTALAEALGEEPAQVEALTTANAHHLFADVHLRDRTGA